MSRLGIFFSLLLAVLVIAVIMPAPPVPADQGGVPHVPDEILVKYKVNTTQAQKDQIRGEIHGHQMKSWGRIRAELNHLQDGVTVEEAIARLQGNPHVEYAEPNYIVSINEVPNDPMFPQLWGMQNTGQTGGTAGADIHATNAWDVFTGSDSVLVGVIDTGVDYTHPDLAANIWTNPGEIPGNGIDDDGNGYIDDIHGWDFINNDNDPMDDHGHGTHVSGTIGAVGNNGIGVAGVNWHIKIMGLKFLSAGGSGSTDDAVDAIYYATMMGVRLTSNSWGGGGFSQTLYDAIQDAGTHNILFVAAAGNDGRNTDTSPSYPASYDLPNIVSVAATDDNDELASFSNYGLTTVDLAAPGVDITSTFPGNSYGTISGTSMATPHVSGALGLIFGRFPGIGALDAKNLLLNFADPIPAMTGKCVTGARLNAFLPIAEPDSIPPAAINDLAVTTVGSNWMDIAWTAPGDDGNTGTASRYDVRYSTGPITPANFGSATPADNPPDPGPAGTPETMHVAGLDFSTTYYFAVKALDEFGNAGPISNVPSGTTLGAPDIDVTPTSLTETLLTGATSTQNLTLSNLNANTTLDFDIPLPELITNPVEVQAFVDVPKGGVDARSGDPVVEGSGGPDAFGYRWVDSNESYGPVFQWTDISGTGTAAITTGDDTNNGPFPIGFTFPFYGIDYTDFRVCSNGFVSLTSTSTAYSNQPLPNSGAPPTLIAPFWDDLVVSAGSSVYYESDGSTLTVQWNNVTHYDGGGPYTFQAILHDDGSIVYQYLSIGSPDNSATVGIQNSAQTDGLNVAFNTAYIQNNLAIRIQAVPQWMTVTPMAGTVFGPGSTTLDVDFDAGGLLGGTYDGTIHVGSNDPDENPFDIPVTLTVIGAPDIAVEPLSYDFGQVFLGATPSHTFAVRNPGTDTLHVSSISIDDAAYTPSLTSLVVPPRSSLPLDVTFAPAAVQLYPATMTLLSDDPDNPSVAVSLAGEGVEPPQFQVSPTSLTSNLLTGQSENQVLTIANNGGADLDYDIAVDLGTQVLQYTSAGELPKDAVDTNPGVLGTGGPDNFGYSWIDSDEPGGPLFDWTDISSVGTPVFTATTDDGNSGPFPIGFDFSFYGNTFSDFRVCSNGWLSFTSSLTGYSNVALPNNGSAVPENLLAVFWDDMKVDFAQGGQVFYYNDGGKLIVQFDNVIHYGQSGGPYFTFQVQLYPNGTILYQYLTLGAIQNSQTIGIQNATKDDGLTVVYNATYVHENMAIRIASSPDWLSANPASGTVAPGDTAHVNVRFNAEGLFGGRYEGFVNVNTNDPVAPHVQVPTTLNVTGAPDIDVNPLALDFGQVFVGYPDLLTFRIANVGTDLLTVTSLTTDDPDFTVDFSNITLPLNLNPLQQALVTVRYAPSTAGPDVGHLMIGSNDADESTVSVDLTGEGLIAPVAGVDPDSLYSDLLTGETENQSFTLSNTGGSDLTYQIQALTAFDSQVVVADALDLGKEDVDPRPGILGSGGPDNFGYSWKDSDEPGGPVPDWVDISGTGTAVFSSRSDDVNTGPFPVGFDFPFYGNTFNSFRVSSNGWVSFTNTTSDLSNDPLPSSGGPENLLAPFWDDMIVDPAYGGEVYYEYDGSKLIIQYESVLKYNITTPPYYTFEILLYPNGTILYQYLTLGTTLNSCTVGIQNDARDDGLNVVYNDDYLHDNMAIRIATSPDWLSANPTSGVIPPGGSIPVSVHFNAAGLFGGRYEGALRVLSNDPAHGILDVAATLDVTGVPRIGFDPAALDFGDVYVGYSDSLDLVVSNIGTDHLSVSSMTPGLGDYSVDPATLELDPLQSAVVKVTFTPGTDGPRNSMLTVDSNDPDSPHMVNLAGNGVLPPVMAMEPDTMVGASLPGDVQTKSMTICNTGGSDLTFSMTWAEVTGTQSVESYGYQEIPKGTDVEGAAQPVDPRPGILGSGGPDGYGYTWIDSDDPSGPTFDWVDVSGVGTPIDFGGSYRDDGNSGPMPIGFSFPFYGQDFTEVNACTNGWLSFTSSLTTYSNQPLPNNGSAVPENLLAVFWDDMVYDESYGASAYYYYDGTRAIFQFNDIRRIAVYTAPFYSYEVILYPNGNILYQYQALGATTNSATVGIQNATKDDGLTVVFNDTYVHDNLAVLFSSRPQWLSVSPESGVVPAGECVELTVTMDATSLEEGDYFGTVHASSNDPAHPEGEDMAVVFHVQTVYATDANFDPNTLNTGSNGKYVTACVELPEGYDPNDVVPETVRLNHTVPADPNKVTIGDCNSNGIPDIQFKFDRAAVEAVLGEGDSVSVVVTGEIEETAFFWAEDMIRVINPHVTSPNGGERLPVGAAVDVVWTNPDGWNVDHADLYYSADDGVSWNAIAQNVQAESYTWMIPDDLSETARVRVYLYDGKGVMGYDSSDEPFTIAEAFTGTGPVVPIAHALKQNAPNPFLGATRIAFDLPANESVNLVIYDVAGRAVRVLERNELPAGSYVRTWDGRDETGHALASGIYFYRLTAGSFTATKRMFLMK